MRNVVHAIRDYMGYCRNQKRLSNNTIRAYNIDMRQFVDYLCDGDFDKLDVNEVTKDILNSYVMCAGVPFVTSYCRKDGHAVLVVLLVILSCYMCKVMLRA